MKRLIIGWLLVGLLVSCSGEKEIRISGDVKNVGSDAIFYHKTTKGVYDSKFVETLPVDSDGRYELHLPGGDYERIFFLTSDGSALGSMIVSSGKMQIDIDGEAEQKITTHGVPEINQEIAAILDHYDEAEQFDRWQISDDSSAVRIAARLKKDILSQDKKLSEAVPMLCFRARQALRMQLLRAFQKRFMEVTPTASPDSLWQWKAEYRKILGFCEISHMDSPFSPVYAEAFANHLKIDHAAKDIHFPDIHNVNTFRELTDLYKGKVILVDIWATWCAPCLESFQHVRHLQNYKTLYDEDIVLLYISANAPDEEGIWKETITRYDLKGEHVCMNGELEKDIYRLFGDKRGNIAIPYGAIIDREGNIAVKKASALENTYKLIRELNEVRMR